MSDKIAEVLGMVTLEEATSNVTDVIPYQTVDSSLIPSDEVDPQFEQACQDFEEVRDNMRQLISDSYSMFNEVKDVAIRSQDADQYNAAARFLELSIRANRELLSTHRDIFAMKPPTPPQNVGQSAEQINNVFVATSASELLDMLNQKGIGVKR